MPRRRDPLIYEPSRPRQLGRKTGPKSLPARKTGFTEDQMAAVRARRAINYEAYKAKRRAAAQARKESLGHCKFTTQKGNRCKRTSMVGGHGCCWQHCNRVAQGDVAVAV